MKVNSEGVSAARVYLPADQVHSNLRSFLSRSFLIFNQVSGQITLGVTLFEIQRGAP